MPELIHDGHPFTSAQAPALGLDRVRLREALAVRRVRREFRDVYVDSRVPDSRRGRLRAIALVKPDGAIACNETAAWLYGLDVFAPGQRRSFTPSFVVAHGSTRIERPGVDCRQAIIDSEDLDFVDGIHVTNPLRTTSDLLRRMYRPYGLAAADAFAKASLVSVGELQDYVARLKGFRGIVQARSLAAIVEPKAESPGESWQRLQIWDAGFPMPESQHEVVDDLGRVRRLDLAYPEILVASEFDGREFHTDPVHQAHDAERRDYLSTAYGWRWCNGSRERLFGSDHSFEHELGSLLGMEPLPRRWGSGR
jgi:hypothetical protein